MMLSQWQTIDKRSERLRLPCGSIVRVVKEGHYTFRWYLEFADGTKTTGAGTTLDLVKKRWLTHYRVWLYKRWAKGTLTPDGFLVDVRTPQQ